MSHELSSRIREQIAHWIAANGATGRADAQALREAYKQGSTSSTISLAAYLTTRLPATYAAAAEVLAQVREVLPQFQPSSLLDVGAGPGTASFAAQAAWPSLKAITMIESDARFAGLAKLLSPEAEVLQQSLQHIAHKADVVIAAYVFAELPEAEAAPTALKLWVATQSLLIIIEPGTPKGFARVRAARKALIKSGAHLIGPCTHANACPMALGDWCHFKTRLPRSRAHMQAKSATVPFEDESFAWLAVSRNAARLAQFRIIAPPSINKVAVKFKTCGAGGVAETAIASRLKPAYKLARKKKWGECLDV